MLILDDDYFVAAEGLKALLEQSNAFKKVYTANELSDVDEKSQVTPSAHIVYLGDKAPSNAQGGNTNQTKQVWAVVIATRQSIHERPGQLIVKALAAVTGQVAQVEGKRIGPFTRDSSAIKPKYTKGFAYMPLVFSVLTRFNP